MLLNQDCINSNKFSPDPKHDQEIILAEGELTGKHCFHFQGNQDPQFKDASFQTSIKSNKRDPGVNKKKVTHI